MTWTTALERERALATMRMTIATQLVLALLDEPGVDAVGGEITTQTGIRRGSRVPDPPCRDTRSSMLSLGELGWSQIADFVLTTCCP